MARVTGIGGVFLRSKDPGRLAKWYADHLGVEIVGGNMAMFSWADEAANGMTLWSAFPEKTEYFGTGKETPQTVMINYRVDDLEALLAKLAGAGVAIDPKRDESDFGKFAWVEDCDGNRLELWQPPAASGTE